MTYEEALAHVTKDLDEPGADLVRIEDHAYDLLDNGDAADVQAAEIVIAGNN